MTNDNKSMTVLFGMAFLIIMIVLPPLFRVLFPKTVESNEPKKQILSCERVISNSSYSTYVEVTYINDQLEQSQTTYTKIDDDAKVNAKEGQLPPEEESQFFTGLNSISITNDDKSAVVILNKDSLGLNNNNETLAKYLQPLTQQEKFYSELGYNCSVNEG